MSNVPHLKHPIRHLLMDLDGTLIDSGSMLVHLEFIGRVMPIMKKHRGWGAAWSAMKETAGMFKVPTSVKTNHERMVDIFQKHLQIPFEEAEKQVALSLTEVFPKLKRHFGQIEGAAAFVEWAKRNYTLTLATNPVWRIELVHMRMVWGGISPSDFSSVTTSDRMHSAKPNPEYFKELLAQEKFDVKDCLFVGNERKMDLPATAVGIPVFLIRTDAKRLSCIIPPSDASPGAWRGNYQHLQKFLETSPR